MIRRRGVLFIGLAIIMLLFSLIAAAVIANIGSNLFKSMSKMGQGQEKNYTRIVVQSVDNGLGYLVQENLTVDMVGATSNIPPKTFFFKCSTDLCDNPVLDARFDVAATFSATTSTNDRNVFEVLTWELSSTGNKEGVVILADRK